MSKGSLTREAIVDRALYECVRNGFRGTSLAVLADGLSLSKSGLFAHFKSKEALELAVLEEAVARFRRQVGRPALAAEEGLPRLHALFDGYLKWIKGDHPAGGCPFAALAQELDDQPGPARERLVAAQREWRDAIAGAVKQAIERKQLPPSVDPRQFAFEMVGIGLSFQIAFRLLGDRGAASRARRAFARLLAEPAAPAAQ